MRRWRRWCIEKTGGNPFFAIQFLTALDEEGLLAFDPDSAALALGHRSHPAPRAITDNVVDLMVGKLNRLARSHAGGAEAARLPRQRRRDRHPGIVS